MNANKQQFCAITGWSAREFDRYVVAGLPVVKKTSSRGDIWQVDTVEAIGWIVNRAVAAAVGDPAPEDQPGAPDINGARARLLTHQGDIAAMEAAKMRGELVDRRRIEAALAVMDLALKDRLLTVPMACAPEALDAAREGGTSAAAGVIARHINYALVDIASAEVVTAGETKRAA